MEVVSGQNVTVYELFDSFVIENGTEQDRNTSVSNNVLTIYTGSSENYTFGNVKLFVKHVDSLGNIIRVDEILAGEIKE